MKNTNQNEERKMNDQKQNRTTTLELHGLTFTVEEWETTWPTTLDVSYIEHPAHCGDSDTETTIRLDMDDAVEIMKILIRAFPNLANDETQTKVMHK